jgi:DNA-binding transcriptional MocR family regulator
VTGPGPLVGWLSDRFAVPAGELFVTAGASHALDLVCASLVTRADTVLVDSPTYHLGLRIIGDHAAAVVPAPVEEPGALADLVARLRAGGRPVPLLYLVPTFNNPTGGSLAGRAALVDAARRTGIAIVEDDTYRELSYDGRRHPRCTTYGGAPVIRSDPSPRPSRPACGSVADRDPALVNRLAERGYAHSGGGGTTRPRWRWRRSAVRARTTATARIRAAYRAARDALVAAVHRHLPGAEFIRPAGGWFLWLRMPDGVDTDRLLPRAEACGGVPARLAICAQPGRCRLPATVVSMLEPEPLGRVSCCLGDGHLVRTPPWSILTMSSRQAG